jgi:excisionase family DNA binding protein
MDSTTPIHVPLPLTLNLVDVTVVLDALAKLSADLAALRRALVTDDQREYANPMMTMIEVAQHLRVHRRTVARWVSTGMFPNGVRMSRIGSSRRLWKRADVEAWIARHDV